SHLRRVRSAHTEKERESSIALPAFMGTRKPMEDDVGKGKAKPARDEKKVRKSLSSDSLPTGSAHSSSSEYDRKFGSLDSKTMKEQEWGSIAEYVGVEQMKHSIFRRKKAEPLTVVLNPLMQLR